MKTNKNSWMIWLGGLVAGIAAGSLIYQNREQINQKNLSKAMDNLKKTGNEIGKLVREVSQQTAEKGKALTNQAVNSN